MVRGRREAARQSLPHNEGSAAAPGRDAPKGQRKKSAPPGQTVKDIATLWAGVHGSTNHRAVAKEVITNLGHLQPEQLTPLMVGALLAQWRKRLRRNTVANYRGKLQQFLNAAQHFGAPPIRAPKVPPQTARPTIATGEELAKLMAQPSAWLRLYMLLYFQCGLRRAETLRLTPRTWNRETHTVTIPTKGGTVRTAEVTSEVEALFAACGEIDPDKPFLEALHGRPLTGHALTQAWQRLRQRAGVNPGLNAHDLRRTAATILYTATKDLRVPQQLLGHKKLESTLSYLAPLHPDEARKYAELLRFDKFHSEVKQ